MRVSNIRYICASILSLSLSSTALASSAIPSQSVAAVKPAAPLHLKFDAFTSHEQQKTYHFTPKIQPNLVEKNPLFNGGLSSFTKNQTAYETEAYKNLSNPSNPADQYFNFRPNSNNFSFNGNQFGLSGAVDLGATYNDMLGMIYRAQYSHDLFGHNTAFSIIANYGSREMRGNITVAHQFNAHNRAKFTYEYLRQKLSFDFASGNVNKWVGQNAY